MSTASLRTTSLEWSSSDPHLSGNFTPIGPEIDAADLAVISGRIPPELRGIYLRNGPNPEFEPISYTYPMDGDGMLHAVRLKDGRASYRNRFVHTRGLAAERRLGRAIYGGLLRPVPVDPALVGPDGEKGRLKAGAFVSVLSQGPALVAVGEAQPAYQITADLETLGEWQAGTDHVVRLGAHNHRHPHTGDLFAICYSTSQPLVQVLRFGPDATLAQTIEAPLEMPSMIHDFVLTERWLVFIIGPAVFDAQAPTQGKPLLQYRPELGTRIGCLPLAGGPTRWLETDPFFVFHFANGFDRDGEIVVDYVRHANLKLGPGAEAPRPAALHRLVIDPRTMQARDSPLVGFVTEFPRIDDARQSLPARFAYLPTLSASFGGSPSPSGTFNSLAKVDVETGAVAQHDFGRCMLGEATFVPRPDRHAEDDGYLVTFAYDMARATSGFVILDASHIEDEPVAVIALPQRVPQGLHGLWLNQP